MEGGPKGSSPKKDQLGRAITHAQVLNFVTCGEKPVRSLNRLDAFPTMACYTHCAAPWQVWGNILSCDDAMLMNKVNWWSNTWSTTAITTGLILHALYSSETGSPMWWIPHYHTHCPAVRQVSLVEIIRGLFFHFQQFHPIFRNSLIIYIVVIVAILSWLTIWQHHNNILLTLWSHSFFWQSFWFPPHCTVNHTCWVVVR